MSTAHVIRLRGPWYYEPLARTVLLADGTTCEEPGELPRAGRTQMPQDWGATLGHEFRGRVRFRRAFHRPTGLDEFSRVELVVTQVDAFGDVTLNGQRLGSISADRAPGRFDVTNMLQLENQLEIDVELPRVTAESALLPRPHGRRDLPGGLTGEVSLQIW